MSHSQDLVKYLRTINTYGTWHHVINLLGAGVGLVPTHPHTSLLLTTYPDTTAVHLTKLHSALQGGRIGHCYLEKCFECYSWIISYCHCHVFLWDDDHDPRKQLVTSILQLNTGNYCDTFVFTEMIALQYLDIILIYTKPSLPMINYKILWKKL